LHSYQTVSDYTADELFGNFLDMLDMDEIDPRVLVEFDKNRRV